MARHRIALIPADGIGPEVVDEGVRVLRALAKREPRLEFDFTRFPWGATIITKPAGCARRTSSTGSASSTPFCSALWAGPTSRTTSP